MHHPTRSALLVIIILHLGWHTVLRADDNSPVLFGVFPFLSPAQLEHLFIPVAIDLSDTINRPVQFRTRPSFSDFDDELRKQTYDLVFIQPFEYARFARSTDYQAIARQAKPMRAIIVTTEDSEIKTIGDLRNKVLATPPPSAAVSLLGLRLLLNNNLQPDVDLRLDHQSSHFACMRRVLIGKAGACVTAGRPLNLFEEKSKIRFRVVAESETIPASTFAVHRRLDPALRDRLTQRITGWRNHPEGQRILEHLHQSYYIPSADSDYNPVREILRSLQETALPEHVKDSIQ